MKKFQTSVYVVYKKIYKSEVYIAKFYSFLDIIDYLKSAWRYYKTYKNFIEVLRAKVNNRFPLEAELRNGKRVKLDSPEMAYAYTILSNSKLKVKEINDEYIEFIYGKRNLKFYGCKYRVIGMINTFIFRQYDNLNVKG